MLIEPLPASWPTTRHTLQAYAQALTAFPRAGAQHDPRWGHVAMELVFESLRSAPTPLGDGTALESEIDLHRHRIAITAGDDTTIFDMTEGPSPLAIGTAISHLVTTHGSSLDVDTDRFADAGPMEYDPTATIAFVTNARHVVSAMESVNERLDGEVTGPHLWPHGFDIATEWYSEKRVVDGDSEGNAQIAFGWYPGAEESYVYVNPWPFDDAFTDIEVSDAVVWNLEGWYGAKLDIPEGGIEVREATRLAEAIHRGAGPALRA